MAIKVVLRCFEISSRLKVNFRKSHIGTIGVCDMDKIIFFNSLKCNQLEILFKYLAMKIGGNPRTLAFWKSVIDKIKSRFSTWKGKIISMAGRICLIKSILNALPLFYFSFFKAPTLVCKIIRRK